MRLGNLLRSLHFHIIYNIIHVTGHLEFVETYDFHGLRVSDCQGMYVCKEEGVQVFVGAAAPAVRMAHLHT